MEMFKVALVSTSQKSFPGDKEGRFRASAGALGKFLQPLQASLYVYPETVITGDDARKALAVIEGEAPDFLLVQNTSFTAGYVAQVFGACKYPTGFWAIPEGVEGGVMQFNSLCSINMHGAIVRAYYPDRRIPLKWFYGEVSDELFARRMEITIGALRAIKAVCRANVALIGGIAPGFNDLYFDERKLLSRFPGLRFDRLPEFSDIADRARSYQEKDLTELARAYECKAARGVCDCSAGHALDNARFLKAYRDFIAETGADAIAVSCWPKFMDQFDYSICSVIGTLNDEGVCAACEGDVLSAVSMLLLKNITGDPTMLMDLSAFDEKDDTVLMWHCGPASAAFCSDAGYSLSGNYSGKAHIDGKPPICCGVARDMVFRPQKATIGHIAGECDEMLVAGGRFIDGDKPSYYGSRGWLGELSVAGEKTTARDFMATILDKGLSHHYPVMAGDYADTLMEIACWLGMKPIEKTTYKPYLKMD